MGILHSANKFIRTLYHARYMIRILTHRELKSQYVGSIFGFAWAVLNPLFQLTIYGVVFGVFFRSTPDPVYTTHSFLLYLLCGLIPWQFFTQCLSSSCGSLINNQALIKRAVGFPAEILPIITILSNSVNHLVSLAVLLLVIAVTHGLSLLTPLIIIYFVLIAVMALGISWLISLINVYFKDVQQIVSVVLMGWFFATPIVYSPSLVPIHYACILNYNPMFIAVDGYRLILLAGKAPSLYHFCFLTVFSFCTLILGGVLFRKIKPMLVEGF